MGLLNGTDTLGLRGGTPGWLTTVLTGEGSVNLEASVLSVANSLMVSMIERVLTPLFCSPAVPPALLLLGIITSAISFLEKNKKHSTLHDKLARNRTFCYFCTTENSSS